MRDESKLLNVREAGEWFAQDQLAKRAGRPFFFGEDALAIHEYERERMGQELHDSAGQLLVSLQLSLIRLKATTTSGAHEELLNELQDTVRQIDQEIRSLAFLHYPAELGERGLYEALRSLVDGFGRRTSIRTSFETAGERTDVPQPLAITVLRVVQEALVNIHRHSQASCAKVRLEERDGQLRLSVSDDGVGIPPVATVGAARGIGLLGMRYRVEQRGGEFRVRRLKRGTRISAVMPLTD